MTIFETAAGYAQTYTGSADKGVPGFLTHLFEQAILAERERCANVARHLNGWGPVGGNKVAEHIAKVIEAGT